MIPKEKLDELRLHLDQQNVAMILTHIGYEIFRTYKFRLRKDEKTPSASIRYDGYITDFGGDFKGDVIALLQDHHDLTFTEAIIYVATCTGVEL